jgi:outer membrane protein TolC
MRHLAWLTLSLISLSACTVGPDFQRPESPQPATQWAEPQGRQAASRAVSDPLQERWWDVFHDAQLSALTRRALSDNLDLKLASSRLQQSRAVRQVTTAERYPSVMRYRRLRAQTQQRQRPERPVRREWPRRLQPVGRRVSPPPGNWTSGAGSRRETEAADATLQVAENDRRAVLLSVLAETAQDYIQLRGVQNTRAVTEQNLDVARHSLKLSQLRLADGVATDLDVAEAAAQVAAIEARLPDLQQRQDQLINALSLLMGEAPQALHAQLSQGRGGAADPAPGRDWPAVAAGTSAARISARPRRACTRRPPASAWPRATSTHGSPCRAASAPRPCNCRIWAPGARAPLPSARQLSLPLFNGGRLQGMVDLREAQQQEAALGVPADRAARLA